MEDLKLIYVLYVGEDWKGDYIYDFIFSDKTEDVDGEDWDVYPASNKPSPPRKSSICGVGRFITDEIKLDVIQESDTFAVWDAIDDVIALAWENVVDYEEYPETRLCFRFGDTGQKVIDVLYSRDITLEIKKVKNEFKS